MKFEHKSRRMNGMADSLPIAARVGWSDFAAAELPLLATLPKAVRERLLASSHMERFAPRAQIFGDGEAATHLHLILSGIVDLAAAYKGGECSALMMAAGDVFMPAAALYSEPYLVSAHSLTASRILMIDADVVRAEARACVELALGLARVLAGQWRVALKIILDLKCRSPSQRLAAFLLRLHDGTRPGIPPEVPFSKRQLASRIGMQPETLSRTLQTLAANGLYLRGRQIVILDRVKAEDFCGPDPYPAGDEHELGVFAL